jgi:CheY-like chemotaxis protein
MDKVSDNNQLKTQNGEIDHLKNVIMKNLNHEFRTPMTSILGFSELLIDSLSGTEYEPVVQKIFDSANRLQHTLNLLMVLSELESEKNKVVLKEFNISELTKSISDQYRYLAEKKKLMLVFYSDSEVWCMANRLFVTQVLENLLDNALKFTETGTIKITVGVATDKDVDYAQIEIQDTGIGIQDSFQQQIFDEFRQISEGNTRRFEGIGLGLTVGKKLVELMNGSIFFKSVPEKGSTFYIRLPLVKREMHIDEMTVVTQMLGRSVVLKKFNSKHAELPLLLLVEDNSINVELMMLYLKDICHVVHTFDGVSAINLARENHFDAILMDINLGLGINGIDTLRSIRKIQGYEETPVIAITGYTNPADIEKLRHEGFIYYLSKPFTKVSLFEIIKNTLFTE